MKKFLHIIFEKLFSVMVFHFRYVILKRRLSLAIHRKQISKLDIIDNGKFSNYYVSFKVFGSVSNELLQNSYKLLYLLRKCLAHDKDTLESHALNFEDREGTLFIMFWLEHDSILMKYLFTLPHNIQLLRADLIEEEVIQ